MEDKNTQRQEIDKLVDELHDVVRQLLRLMRQEVSLYDLSMSQVSVIAKLDVPGGLTGAELARAEGVKPQSMSATVASLEELGFIQRRPDPVDGRRIVLSLTEAGREVRRKRLAAKQVWLRSVIEQLSPTERQELQRGLELLGRISR
jgi:DNA-binding MarR family transcriptional regulator